MTYQKYKNQVRLLLSILPIVNEEDSFALHGGTAINLFHCDMPRLSVDIDLTYLPVQDRDSSLAAISEILSRIKNRIERLFSHINVEHKVQESKLIVNDKDAIIKVEVNQIKRGCFLDPVVMVLCDKAQQEFDVFCEMKVVEMGHLYGGKVCAALDRQHPRDLFDIKLMLEKFGFSEEIKTGFLFYLISSNRPIVEMLMPNEQNQSSVFENQFAGMTKEAFCYEDYEETKQKLVRIIQNTLTVEDKRFLVSIEEGNPDWSLYDFKVFPAVKWKLINIQRLLADNPQKHREGVESLQDLFENLN